MFYKESEIVNEIITPTIRLRLLRNSIIHYTFLADVKLDMEQLIFNHNAYIEIATLKQHPMLIDAIDGFVDIDAEGRNFIRAHEPIAPILARAFVTSSLANKLIISFYYRINKSMYPLKTFNNYKEAQEWLLKKINEAK